MKKVIVTCQFIVNCSAEIQVPDDFEFDSPMPDERISELEDIVDVNFDKLIPTPEVKSHPSIGDIEFYDWYDVDFD